MSNRWPAATSAAILLVGLGVPSLASEDRGLTVATAAAEVHSSGSLDASATRREASRGHVLEHCFAPSPLGPKETEALVRRAATAQGVNADLAVAVARRESQMGRLRVSPAGAMGTMQLMPGTAEDLGVRDACDPTENVPAGVRYLKALLDRFGEPVLALAAYNAGPTRVAALGGVPPFPETKAYVSAVLADAEGTSVKETRARVRDLAASRVRRSAAAVLTLGVTEPAAPSTPSPIPEDDPWIDGIVQHF